MTELILDAMNRWTGPLGVLSILVGGVVWLNDIHGISEENRKDISEIVQKSDVSKSKIYSRLNDLDTRLGRIEGKLDMIINSYKK